EMGDSNPAEPPGEEERVRGNQEEVRLPQTDASEVGTVDPIPVGAGLRRSPASTCRYPLAPVLSAGTLTLEPGPISGPTVAGRPGVLGALLLRSDAVRQ